MTYTFLDKFVLRTASLPLNSLEELLDKTEVSKDELKLYWSKPIVQLAILNASPYVYDQLDLFFTDSKAFSKKKEDRLLNTFTKYLIRLCSRPTPFGFFAGLSVGDVSHKTEIKLSNTPYLDPHIRYDLSYLRDIGQEALNDHELRKQLLYTVNPSLYPIRNNYRYYEATKKNEKTIYSLEAVEKSEILEIILDKSTEEVSKEDLINSLLQEYDVSYDALDSYIDDLIDNYVLISNAHINLTGEDYFERLVQIIEQHDCTPALKSKLNKLNEVLSDLSHPPSQAPHLLNQLKAAQATLDSDEDQQRIRFHTDLFNRPITNKLNRKHLYQLNRLIPLLYSLRPKARESRLERFKRKFQERYEKREVDLLKVLDPDIGIPYSENYRLSSKGALLDNILLPNDKVHNVELNLQNKALHERLQQCIRRNELIMDLSDFPFDPMNVEEMERLPHLFSSMFELLIVDDRIKLILKSMGSASASRLIGRFGGHHKELDRLIDQICELENANSNNILAEIAFAPGEKADNVCRRTWSRDYEISLACYSTQATQSAINLSDLVIVHQNDRLILKSKKLDRPIVPILSNAHNYDSIQMPIYQFLNDLYYQDQVGDLAFRWNDYETMYDYLPRLEYKDIILAKAKWKITKQDFLPSLEVQDDRQLLSKFESKRRERGIPKKFSITQNDQLLYINSESSSCLKLLRHELSNQDSIWVEEYLGKVTPSTDSKGQVYANEFITFFSKAK